LAVALVDYVDFNANANIHRYKHFYYKISVGFGNKDVPNLQGRDRYFHPEAENNNDFHDAISRSTSSDDDDYHFRGHRLGFHISLRGSNWNQREHSRRKCHHGCADSNSHVLPERGRQLCHKDHTDVWYRLRV